jgi:hypothetical protein
VSARQLPVHKGERKGQWAVSSKAKTSRQLPDTGEDVTDIDLIDYH